MTIKKPIFTFLIICLLFLVANISSGQVFEDISGIVNDYSPVTEFYERRAGSDVNAVKVTEPDSFAVGDVVILYVSKGWNIITEGDDDDLGKASDIFPHPNVGAYSINKIDSILPGGIIVFVAPTPFKDSLKYNEMAQLVKVPALKNARVTAPLRGQHWSESSGEGGIIALFVEGNLKLEADIDATGIGFEGADPAGDDYTGGCYDDDPVLYGKGFYLASDDHIAGPKGEGAVESTFTDSIRGRKPLLNGGGGGNAKFSGGGGGSNYSPGGAGGSQASECGASSIMRGQGGHGLGDEYYYNYTNEIFTLYNRLYFGGGGGASTQTAAINGSPGGDGGGIVIIIADTIEATSSVSIKARGETVTDIALAGGGGGGGGGCIVIDANFFKGEVHLSARGGKGGDTNNSSYTGPGGGGGGGIYWLRKDSSNVVYDLSEGLSGKYIPTQNAAVNGSPADVLLDLEPPLNGFLFNTLPNDRTVCTDEIPDTLFASEPKGGLGPGSYTYKWQYKKPADTEWDSLPVGDTNQYYVFKSVLTEPLQLRRIVRSGGLEEGDDVFITYFVTEKLEGNQIKSPDIICYGLTAETLVQDGDFTLQGADMPADTSFRWIRSTDGGATWTDAAGINDKYIYTPSGDTESSIYSRVVYSGVCDDTSNTVSITVLPLISDNDITDTDTICMGQVYGGFTGLDPQGGDGNYTYVWQVSNDMSSWGDSLISSSNTPFNLSEYDQTKYIRRVIYSGEDSACVDQSEVDTITVLDPIIKNSITTAADTITICQFSALPEGGVNGSIPEGGDGVYSYTWQIKTKSTDWSSVSNVAPDEKFNQASFDDTTYVRRQILSGSDDVCSSISDTLVLGMVWEIHDNLITTDDATYCQEDLLPEFTAQQATGGANGLGIEWQVKTITGNYEPAPGVNNNWNYTFPGRIFETLSFRRMVWSQPVDSVCVDYSDTLLITVQDSISQNRILEVNGASLVGRIDSICSGLNLLLTGSDDSGISGGDGVSYNYKWESSSVEDFSILDSTASGEDFEKVNFRDSAFFRRIVSSGTCLDTARVLIYPIDLPQGDLDYGTGQADEVCASQEIPVQLSVKPVLDQLAKGYTVYSSYTSEEHSGSNSFTFDSPGPGNIEFTTMTDSVETYTYLLDSIIDDRGCVSEVDLTGQPVIKVYFSPEAALTAFDTAVCGSEVYLTATNKGGVSFTWSAQTEDPAFPENPVTLNENGLLAYAKVNEWFNDTAVITYGFTIETSGALGLACADSAFTTVTHYQEPLLPPYFDRNATDAQGDSIAIDSVYFADTYQLIISNESLSGKGIWTVEENAYGMLGDNPEDPDMIANLSNELDVDNVFVWTVSNGVCAPQSDRMVVRRKDVDVFEGISPNGDGLNDVLAMRGIRYAEKMNFTVFNSWGTPIFRMNENDANQFVSLIPNDPESEQLLVLWDGKVNGNVVPDGTYYYTISFVINVGTEREKEYSKKKYLVVSTQLVE